MDLTVNKWTCDICGDFVDNVTDGYVVWKTDEDLKAHSFKIIHQGKCDSREYTASMPLSYFVGSDGISCLMSLISHGPIMKSVQGSSFCKIKDLDEFADLVRRLHVPHYEEARQNFGHEQTIHIFGDANEAFPYLTDQLEKISRLK